MKKILTNKLFMVTFLSDLLSNFGDSLYYLALMNYVLLLPDAKFAISLVTLSETLPMVSMLMIGMLADRVKDKLNMILGTQLLRTLLYLIVGLIMGFSPSLWVVLVAVVVNVISDLSGQFESYLFMPVSLRIVSDEDREATIAFKQGISSSMQLVFQTSGAILVGFMTYQTLAFVNAATFFISALILLAIRPALKRLFLEKPLEVPVTDDKPTKGHFLANTWQSLKEAYQASKGIPFLSSSLMVIVFINAVGSSVDVLLLTTMKDFKAFVLISPATTLAALMVSHFIGKILGSLLSTTLFQSVDLVRMTKIVTVFQLPFFLGFFIHNIVIVLVMLLMSSILSGIVGPKFSALFYREIPEHQLATVGAGIDTILMAGIAIMRLLLSGLVTLLPAQTISLLFVLLSLALVGYTFKRR